VIYEYAFSQYLPADFPIVPTRLVLAQWKQYCNGREACSDDSPIVAVRYSSGILPITRQAGPHREPLYETRERIPGRWLDYRFQLRFSRRDNGIVRAWSGGRFPRSERLSPKTNRPAMPAQATSI
jgi:hypothetical protein